MTEVTRKDNIISRGLQGCLAHECTSVYISELRVFHKRKTRYCIEPQTSPPTNVRPVHSWATSLQANSLLYGTTDIPAHECTSVYICGLRVCKQTRYCSISRTSLSVLKSLSPLAFLQIACPEVYIRVHFRTRVFAPQKHRC